MKHNLKCNTETPTLIRHEVQHPFGSFKITAYKLTDGSYLTPIKNKPALAYFHNLIICHVGYAFFVTECVF